MRVKHENTSKLKVGQTVYSRDLTVSMPHRISSIETNEAIRVIGPEGLPALWRCKPGDPVYTDEETTASCVRVVEHKNTSNLRPGAFVFITAEDAWQNEDPHKVISVEDSNSIEVRDGHGTQYCFEASEGCPVYTRKKEAEPLKDTNPKTQHGAVKPQLHLIPPAPLALVAVVMEDGGKKYGPYNFRDDPVSASTYVSAAKRHLDAFWDGEDYTSDTGLPNLAAAAACCLIALDCQLNKKLVDDRPPPGASTKVQDVVKAWKDGKFATLEEALKPLFE